MMQVEERAQKIKVCGYKRTLRVPTFNGPQGHLLKKLMARYPKLRANGFDTYMKPICDRLLNRKIIADEPNIVDEWDSSDFIDNALLTRQESWPLGRPDAWCLKHHVIHWFEIECSHFLEQRKISSLIQASDGDFYEAYGFGFQVWLIDRYGNINALDVDGSPFSFPFEVAT